MSKDSFAKELLATVRAGYEVTIFKDPILRDETAINITVRERGESPARDIAFSQRVTSEDLLRYGDEFILSKVLESSRYSIRKLKGVTS